MGVLDNKTRILDTVITQEGRRQLAAGKLKVEFVSFTDAETFYENDAASGSTDPSSRLYFEACNMPFDQITFEADDSGKLVPYRGSSLGVADGKVLSGSANSFLDVVTGSLFSSLSENLLGSSVDNFKKLYAIRTDDAFFDDDREFKTNTNTIQFNITNEVPLGKNEIKKIDVEHIEALFQDKRLSHLPNFRYMPPINKVTDGAIKQLGSYPVIGQRSTPLKYEDLISDILNKEFKTIEFSATTPKSNIACQFFEIKQDSLIKLDVIDFGEVITTDKESPLKHIFFAGKVFIDSFGVQTFVNIFTLIFE